MGQSTSDHLLRFGILPSEREWKILNLKNFDPSPTKQ